MCVNNIFVNPCISMPRHKIAVAYSVTPFRESFCFALVAKNIDTCTPRPSCMFGLILAEIILMSIGWDVKWWPVSRITTPLARKRSFHWISMKSRLVRAAKETSKFQN